MNSAANPSPAPSGPPAGTPSGGASADAPDSGAKLKDIRSRGAARAYLDVTYGPMPVWKALLMELATLLFSGIPGALGIAIRGFVYRPFFGGFGKGVVIGRHVAFRHPSKIFLGDGVVLDDRAVLDAKGPSNDGIALGRRVFVGRGSTIYCKNGDVEIGDGASISANSIVFSSNKLSVGPGTMIGSFCYLLSGGEYDPYSRVPFAEQSGTLTRGPLSVGANCWLGAHVTVLDAASIGDGTVVGAGAVVASPLPAGVLALGVPARPRKTLPGGAPAAADTKRSSAQC